MNHDGYAVDRPMGYCAAVFGGDPFLLPAHDDDTVAGESVILNAFSPSPSLSRSLAVEREIYLSAPPAHRAMKTAFYASSLLFSQRAYSMIDVLAYLLLYLVVVEQVAVNNPSPVTF